MIKNDIFSYKDRMKMNLKIKLSLITFLLLIISINSQSIGRVGTTAAPFLKIGVGARALGMGEAYTTLAQDISGMYWNPAGIANINSVQTIVNHYDYLADLNFDYGGVVFPMENFGTLGVFVGYLGMPDMERTTIQFPNGTGEKVSAGSMVIGLSYGKALTDRFAIGGNVKLIRETIWHSSATGFAFDLGLLYKTFFKNIMIGMSISNFGTQMQMDGRDILVQHDINDKFEGNNQNINALLETEKFPLPILFRVGISSNITKDFFNIENYDWTVAADAVHPNDDKEYMNVGSELKIHDLVALRCGFRKLLLDDRQGGFTFGFGINYTLYGVNMKLDYANVDYGVLDHHNKFSLILAF